MVAVATKEPLRHQTVLASKQRPANPASYLLRTTAADEQAGAPGNTPNSRALPLTTTRSGRIVKPVPRLIDLMMSELGAIRKEKGELLLFAALNDEPEEEYNPLLAYKAVNPDILRLHEAMKAKDKCKFKTAMEKEVNAQIANGNLP